VFLIPFLHDGRDNIRLTVIVNPRLFLKFISADGPGNFTGTHVADAIGPSALAFWTPARQLNHHRRFHTRAGPRSDGGR